MEDRNLCRNPLCLRKSNYIILLFVIPLIYILTVEKKQWFSYQNLIGDYQTLDVDESVTVNISENYHGINLMDVVRWLVTLRIYMHV